MRPGDVMWSVAEDGDTPQHEAGGGRAAAARPRPRQPLQGGGCGLQVRQQLAAAQLFLPRT